MSTPSDQVARDTVRKQSQAVAMQKRKDAAEAMQLKRQFVAGTLLGGGVGESNANTSSASASAFALPPPPNTVTTTTKRSGVMTNVVANNNINASPARSQAVDEAANPQQTAKDTTSRRSRSTQRKSPEKGKGGKNKTKQPQQLNDAASPTAPPPPTTTATDPTHVGEVDLTAVVGPIVSVPAPRTASAIHSSVARTELGAVLLAANQKMEAEKEAIAKREGKAMMEKTVQQEREEAIAIEFEKQAQAERIHNTHMVEAHKLIQRLRNGFEVCGALDYKTYNKMQESTMEEFIEQSRVRRQQFSAQRRAETFMSTLEVEGAFEYESTTNASMLAPDVEEGVGEDRELLLMGVELGLLTPEGEYKNQFCGCEAKFIALKSRMEEAVKDRFKANYLGAFVKRLDTMIDFVQNFSRSGAEREVAMSNELKDFRSANDKLMAEVEELKAKIANLEATVKRTGVVTNKEGVATALSPSAQLRHVLLTNANRIFEQQSMASHDRDGYVDPLKVKAEEKSRKYHMGRRVNTAAQTLNARQMHEQLGILVEEGGGGGGGAGHENKALASRVEMLEVPDSRRLLMDAWGGGNSNATASASKQAASSSSQRTNTSTLLRRTSSTSSKQANQQTAASRSPTPKGASLLTTSKKSDYSGGGGAVGNDEQQQQATRSGEKGDETPASPTDHAWGQALMRNNHQGQGILLTTTMAGSGGVDGPNSSSATPPTANVKPSGGGGRNGSIFFSTSSPSGGLLTAKTPTTNLLELDGADASAFVASSSSTMWRSIKTSVQQLFQAVSQGLGGLEMNRANALKQLAITCPIDSVREEEIEAQIHASNTESKRIISSTIKTMMECAREIAHTAAAASAAENNLHQQRRLTQQMDIYFNGAVATEVSTRNGNSVAAVTSASSPAQSDLQHAASFSKSQKGGASSSPSLRSASSPASATRGGGGNGASASKRPDGSHKMVTILPFAGDEGEGGGGNHSNNKAKPPLASGNKQKKPTDDDESDDEADADDDGESIVPNSNNKNKPSSPKRSASTPPTMLKSGAKADSTVASSLVGGGKKGGKKGASGGGDSSSSPSTGGGKKSHALVAAESIKAHQLQQQIDVLEMQLSQHEDAVENYEEAVCLLAKTLADVFGTTGERFDSLCGEFANIKLLNLVSADATKDGPTSNATNASSETTLARKKSNASTLGETPSFNYGKIKTPTTGHRRSLANSNNGDGVTTSAFTPAASLSDSSEAAPPMLQFKPDRDITRAPAAVLSYAASVHLDLLDAASYGAVPIALVELASTLVGKVTMLERMGRDFGLWSSDDVPNSIAILKSESRALGAIRARQEQRERAQEEEERAREREKEQAAVANGEDLESYRAGLAKKKSNSNLKLMSYTPIQRLEMGKGVNILVVMQVLHTLSKRIEKVSAVVAQRLPIKLGEVTTMRTASAQMMARFADFASSTQNIFKMLIRGAAAGTTSTTSNVNSSGEATPAENNGGGGLVGLATASVSSVAAAVPALAAPILPAELFGPSLPLSLKTFIEKSSFALNTILPPPKDGEGVGAVGEGTTTTQPLNSMISPTTLTHSPTAGSVVTSSPSSSNLTQQYAILKAVGEWIDASRSLERLLAKHGGGIAALVAAGKQSKTATFTPSSIAGGGGDSKSNLNSSTTNNPTVMPQTRNGEDGDSIAVSTSANQPNTQKAVNTTGSVSSTASPQAIAAAIKNETQKNGNRTVSDSKRRSEASSAIAAAAAATSPSSVEHHRQPYVLPFHLANKMTQTDPSLVSALVRESVQSSSVVSGGGGVATTALQSSQTANNNTEAKSKKGKKTPPPPPLSGGDIFEGIPYVGVTRSSTTAAAATTATGDGGTKAKQQTAAQQQQKKDGAAIPYRQPQYHRSEASDSESSISISTCGGSPKMAFASDHQTHSSSKEQQAPADSPFSAEGEKGEKKDDPISAFNENGQNHSTEKKRSLGSIQQQQQQQGLHLNVEEKPPSARTMPYASGSASAHFGVPPFSFSQSVAEGEGADKDDDEDVVHMQKTSVDAAAAAAAAAKQKETLAKGDSPTTTSTTTITSNTSPSATSPQVNTHAHDLIDVEGAALETMTASSFSSSQQTTATLSSVAAKKKSGGGGGGAAGGDGNDDEGHAILGHQKLFDQQHHARRTKMGQSIQSLKINGEAHGSKSSYGSSSPDASKKPKFVQLPNGERIFTAVRFDTSSEDDEDEERRDDAAANSKSQKGGGGGGEESNRRRRRSGSPASPTVAVGGKRVSFAEAEGNKKERVSLAQIYENSSNGEGTLNVTTTAAAASTPPMSFGPFGHSSTTSSHLNLLGTSSPLVNFSIDAFGKKRGDWGGGADYYGGGGRGDYAASSVHAEEDSDEDRVMTGADGSGGLIGFAPHRANSQDTTATSMSQDQDSYATSGRGGGGDDNDENVEEGSNVDFSDKARRVSSNASQMREKKFKAIASASTTQQSVSGNNGKTSNGDTMSRHRSTLAANASTSSTTKVVVRSTASYLAPTASSRTKQAESNFSEMARKFASVKRRDVMDDEGKVLKNMVSGDDYDVLVKTLEEQAKTLNKISTEREGALQNLALTTKQLQTAEVKSNEAIQNLRLNTTELENLKAHIASLDEQIKKQQVELVKSGKETAAATAALLAAQQTNAALAQGQYIGAASPTIVIAGVEGGGGGGGGNNTHHHRTSPSLTAPKLGGALYQQQQQPLNRLANIVSKGGNTTNNLMNVMQLNNYSASANNGGSSATPPLSGFEAFPRANGATAINIDAPTPKDDATTFFRRKVGSYYGPLITSTNNNNDGGGDDFDITSAGGASSQDGGEDGGKPMSVQSLGAATVLNNSSTMPRPGSNNNNDCFAVGNDGNGQQQANNLLMAMSTSRSNNSNSTEAALSFNGKETEGMSAQAKDKHNIELLLAHHQRQQEAARQQLENEERVVVDDVMILHSRVHELATMGLPAGSECIVRSDALMRGYERSQIEQHQLKQQIEMLRAELMALDGAAATTAEENPSATRESSQSAATDAKTAAASLEKEKQAKLEQIVELMKSSSEAFQHTVMDILVMSAELIMELLDANVNNVDPKRKPSSSQHLDHSGLLFDAFQQSVGGNKLRSKLSTPLSSRRGVGVEGGGASRVEEERDDGENTTTSSEEDENEFASSSASPSKRAAGGKRNSQQQQQQRTSLTGTSLRSKKLQQQEERRRRSGSLVDTTTAVDADASDQANDDDGEKEQNGLDITSNEKEESDEEKEEDTTTLQQPPLPPPLPPRELDLTEVIKAKRDTDKEFTRRGVGNSIVLELLGQLTPKRKHFATSGPSPTTTNASSSSSTVSPALMRIGGVALARHHQQQQQKKGVGGVRENSLVVGLLPPPVTSHLSELAAAYVTTATTAPPAQQQQGGVLVKTARTTAMLSRGGRRHTTTASTTTNSAPTHHPLSSTATATAPKASTPPPIVPSPSSAAIMTAGELLPDEQAAKPSTAGFPPQRNRHTPHRGASRGSARSGGDNVDASPTSVNNVHTTTTATRASPSPYQQLDSRLPYSGLPESFVAGLHLLSNNNHRSSPSGGRINSNSPTRVSPLRGKGGGGGRGVPVILSSDAEVEEFKQFQAMRRKQKEGGGEEKESDERMQQQQQQKVSSSAATTGLGTLLFSHAQTQEQHDEATGGGRQQDGDHHDNHHGVNASSAAAAKLQSLQNETNLHGDDLDRVDQQEQQAEASTAALVRKERAAEAVRLKTDFNTLMIAPVHTDIGARGAGSHKGAKEALVLKRDDGPQSKKSHNADGNDNDNAAATAAMMAGSPSAAAPQQTALVAVGHLAQQLLIRRGAPSSIVAQQQQQQTPLPLSSSSAVLPAATSLLPALPFSTPMMGGGGGGQGGARSALTKRLQLQAARLHDEIASSIAAARSPRGDQQAAAAAGGGNESKSNTILLPPITPHQPGGGGGGGGLQLYRSPPRKNSSSAAATTEEDTSTAVIMPPLMTRAQRVRQAQQQQYLLQQDHQQQQQHNNGDFEKNMSPPLVPQSAQRREYGGPQVVRDFSKTANVLISVQQPSATPQQQQQNAPHTAAAAAASTAVTSTFTATAIAGGGAGPFISPPHPHPTSTELLLPHHKTPFFVYGANTSNEAIVHRKVSPLRGRLAHEIYASDAFYYEEKQLQRTSRRGKADTPSPPHQTQNHFDNKNKTPPKSRGGEHLSAPFFMGGESTMSREHDVVAVTTPTSAAAVPQQQKPTIPLDAAASTFAPKPSMVKGCQVFEHGQMPPTVSSQPDPLLFQSFLKGTSALPSSSGKDASPPSKAVGTSGKTAMKRQ